MENYKRVEASSYSNWEIYYIFFLTISWVTMENSWKKYFYIPTMQEDCISFY